MARSRSSGNIFSEFLSVSEATEKLRLISSDPDLSQIVEALSPDSDVCIVGGTVRDIICELEQCDIDLACRLHPAEVIARLEARSIKVFDAGIKHGTVTAVIGGRNIEITTFRVPARRESSDFSDSIEVDLEGRDFTINALAFSIKEGLLIDPYLGYRDLTANLLRAVKDADLRLKEDPLRILRMLRFGPAVGRKIENDTLTAASANVSLLKNVSVERIRSELEKILISPFAGEAIRMMRAVGALQSIIPEFVASFDLEQNRFHTEDVFEHTLTVVDNAPRTSRLRLAAFFHDIGKPASLTVDAAGNRHFYNHEDIGQRMTIDIMRRLKFSNDEIHAVSELVRMHMRPLDCGPAGVRRLMRDLGDNFEEWKQLKIADAPPTVSQEDFDTRYDRFEKMVDEEIERANKSGGSSLVIDGYDLIEIGVKPGPFMGSILKTLENEIIENPDRNNKEYLLSRSKELANAPS